MYVKHAKSVISMGYNALVDTQKSTEYELLIQFSSQGSLPMEANETAKARTDLWQDIHSPLQPAN